MKTESIQYIRGSGFRRFHLLAWSPDGKCQLWVFSLKFPKRKPGYKRRYFRAGDDVLLVIDVSRHLGQIPFWQVVAPMGRAIEIQSEIVFYDEEAM